MATSISVSPSGLFGLGATIFQRPEVNRRNSSRLTAGAATSLAADRTIRRNYFELAWFDLAGAATNITTALTSTIAFLTFTDCNTCECFFARATTSGAENRSLPVAFGTQDSVGHWLAF